MLTALSPWWVITGCYALAFVLLVAQSLFSIGKMRRSERRMERQKSKINET